MPEFISVLGAGLRAHEVKTMFENVGFSTDVHADAASVIVVAADTQDEAEEIFFGTEALVAHASAHALIINVSPLTATLAHEVETMATISDIQFVHAGMYASDITTSTPFNVPDNVVFFIGGDENARALTKDYLSRVSTQVIDCGTIVQAVSATLALYLKRMAHIVSVVEMRTFLRQSILSDTEAHVDARLSDDEDDEFGEDAQSVSLNDAQAKKLTMLSDTILSTLDVSPQDFAMLELLDSGEVHQGYPLMMLRGEIQTALFAAQEMGVIFPHAEAAEQLVNLLMLVGAHELGIGALGLLFEDDETCRRAGVDWSRAREEAHHHDEDDEWDDEWDDDYSTTGFGDEHAEFGGEFGSYSAN